MGVGSRHRRGRHLGGIGSREKPRLSFNQFARFEGLVSTQREGESSPLSAISPIPYLL